MNVVPKGDRIMKLQKKAKSFVYRNARALDLARWQYHFESGQKEPVLKALSYYQNKDGGFGHALEPDSWNPNSTPIQTWAATEILFEINFQEVDHPMIQGILKYLESGSDFDGSVWANTIESNNNYPHAPWWSNNVTSINNLNYNPTACLAGFILRFAKRDSLVYQLGFRIAKEAIQFYLDQDYLEDMHTVSCFVRLLEYINESGLSNLFDTENLQIKLGSQIQYSITREKEKWSTFYICKPSQFLNHRDSVYYQDNKEIADYECEFIKSSQLEDGSWNVPWGWGNYEKEWSISENWWKSHIIINNLLYLKGLSSLENV